MSQFVKVGERLVNLEYVSRVEPQPDGTAKIYVDDMPPQVVPADDVRALIEAVRPRNDPSEVRPKPLVPGGLGGEGLPPGMFRANPEPPPPVSTVPPPATAPVIPTPVVPMVPVPAVPDVPLDPIPSVPDVTQEANASDSGTGAEPSADPSVPQAKTKTNKPAAK